MIRNREWPQPGSGNTVTRSTAGDWIRGIRRVALLDERGGHWLTSSRTVHIPPSTSPPHELTSTTVLERDRRLTGHTFGSREHHVAPPGYELTSAWRVRALTRLVEGSDTHSVGYSWRSVWSRAPSTRMCAVLWDEAQKERRWYRYLKVEFNPLTQLLHVHLILSNAGERLLIGLSGCSSCFRPVHNIITSALHWKPYIRQFTSKGVYLV